MNDTRLASLRRRFTDLHRDGCFAMPNPWDVGSARVLATMGFSALATTSAGFAATLGRRDQQVTLDELLDHVSVVASAIDVPLNVDAERCFADDPSGVAAPVEQLAEAGAAGISIEDYDPAHGRIEPFDDAVERVGVAADAAHRQRVTLTARAEQHLYGGTDLDQTIARLRAYREAGADVVYAPGLSDPAHFRRIVDEVGAPVNALVLPGGPSPAELEAVGVRRISTGSFLAWAAYGALVRSAEPLLAGDRWDDAVPRIDRDLLDRALG